MARSGVNGPGASLTTGMSFGVPPIIKFGDQQLQERFLPKLLRGEKRSCIAITEPDAGSDVAGITTTAVKSADGKHYVINGTKKWITNGIWTVRQTSISEKTRHTPSRPDLLIFGVPRTGRLWR